MIEKREKRKKIFYVPGMISLVLIPFVCVVYFYNNSVFKGETCISVHIPSDSITKKQILSHKRNYQIFRFNSSLDLERKKLDEFQLALRKLNKTNDTIKGIQVHMGIQIKYEVYIRILDLFFIEGMPNFVSYKNDFFVWMMPKPKNLYKGKINPFKCGYWEANKDYFLEEERKAKFQYLLSLYKKYWILFLGYFGMVFINLFALVKFNKNQNYNQK